MRANFTFKVLAGFLDDGYLGNDDFEILIVFRL